MPENKVSILSTRPLEPSLSAAAERDGVDMDAIAFIETEPIREPELDARILQLAEQKLVAVFTSMNAVDAVGEMISAADGRESSPGDRTAVHQPPSGQAHAPWRVYCIGAATAKRVVTFFGTESIVGTAPSASALADVILQQEGASGPAALFFFCGDQRRDELPDKLRQHGIAVEEVTVYRTRQTPHRLEKNMRASPFSVPVQYIHFFHVIYRRRKRSSSRLVKLPKKRSAPIRQTRSSAADLRKKRPLSAWLSIISSNNSMQPTLRNDLLLRALRGETTERTPVWMMRQAGRYLPDYMKLKEKYSFFERCQKPELATEITIQPVEQVGVDAAIIFSDILVVPQAMGLEVQMVEGKGPFLPDPIKKIGDLDRLRIPDVNESLGYVFDALSLTKKTLDGRVPLIGFAGAPWTLLCYMVQGKGSKTFDEAKAFCYTQPATAHRLLQMITDTTIAYLKGQVKAGADVIQLFDSWGGLLGPDDFERISLQYIRQIVNALKDEVATIVFAKGAWHSLEQMAATGAHGLGIDWCIRPELARQMAGPIVTLQGNFDPAKLLSPIPVIRQEVKAMLDAFEGFPHIANLGHGILPDVPVDHARAFVDTVKNYVKVPQAS